MKARRIELSLAIEPGTLPDPEAVVPVFHAWIRERALGETLVDVARYGHVRQGPVVILVGHSGDYVIDVTPNGTRFAAIRKRDAASESSRLGEAAERLLAAAVLLEAALPGLRLRTDELSLRVLDRLNAPSTPEALAACSEELTAFARPWLGEVAIEPATEPGGPLALRLTRAANEPAAALRARLPPA